MMQVEAAQYYTLAAAAPDVALKVGALARERIGGLQGVAAEAPTPRASLVGQRWDAACSELRRFLDRNQITFEWITPDAVDAAAAWGGELPPESDWPALRAGGTTLVRPALRDVADLLGLQTRASAADYDAIIVGAGPAGLAAAVYGASEGLRTIVIEREAPAARPARRRGSRTTSASRPASRATSSASGRCNRRAGSARRSSSRGRSPASTRARARSVSTAVTSCAGARSSSPRA